MKKIYITPNIKVKKIHIPSILAGSPETTQILDPNKTTETEEGDEIPTEAKLCEFNWEAQTWNW